MKNTYFNKDVVAYLMFLHRMKLLESILKPTNGSCWLTVGDYNGGDAHYLAQGGTDVLASDISDKILQMSHAAGFIRKYQTVNAKKRWIFRKEFDWVLCNETYHHFPRPGVALYEMLRVAKKGVVLIEPNDYLFINDKVRTFITAKLLFCYNMLTNKNLDITQLERYEATGNYIYRISRREIEKFALGMNYPVVAFKGFNHFYDFKLKPSAYFEEKIVDNGPIQQHFNRFVAFREFFLKLVLFDYKTLLRLFLKRCLKRRMFLHWKRQAIMLKYLARNPYVEK